MDLCFIGAICRCVLLGILVTLLIVLNFGLYIMAIRYREWPFAIIEIFVNIFCLLVAMAMLTDKYCQ